MSDPYALKEDGIWRMVAGHGDLTAVIDTHVALLLDIHDGAVLSHGARRFVENDRRAIIARDRDLVGVAYLEETLALHAKPVAEITRDWLDDFNKVVAAGFASDREIARLFGALPDTLVA